MHRFIMNTPKGKVTDHKNGNSLDNREGNLRVCTVKQNSQHRVRVPKHNKCGTLGVKVRKDGCISARIKGKHLGYFNSIKETNKAYVKAAEKEYGEFAPTISNS